MKMVTRSFHVLAAILLAVYSVNVEATPGGLFAGLEKSLVSISHGGPLVEIDCKYGARTLCAAGGPTYCPPQWLNATNVGRCGIASVSHFVSSGNMAGTCCYTYDDSLPPFHAPKPMSSVAAAFGGAQETQASTTTLNPRAVSNPFQSEVSQQSTSAGQSGLDALLKKPFRNTIVLQPGDPTYAALIQSLTNMPQFQGVLPQGGGFVGMKRGGIFSGVPFSSQPPPTTTTTTTPTPEQLVEVQLAQQTSSPTNPFSFLTNFINPSSLASLFGLRATPQNQPPSVPPMTTAAPLNTILQQSLNRDDAYKQLQFVLAQQIAANKQKHAATHANNEERSPAKPFSVQQVADQVAAQEQLILQNNALKMEKQKLEQQLFEQQQQLQARRQQEVLPTTSLPQIDFPDNPPPIFLPSPTKSEALYSYHTQEQPAHAVVELDGQRNDVTIDVQPQLHPQAAVADINISPPQQADSQAQQQRSEKRNRPKCGIPKHFYRVARAQQVANAASHSPNSYREARIAGGQFSQAGEVCWAAALLDNGNYFAGGVLVDERFVLTAAHEVSNRRAQQLLVRLGDTNLKSSDGGDGCAQVYNVRRITISPVFDPSSLAGDLALLELEPPGADLNPNCVCTVCLRPTLPAEGEWCVVAGYGSTKAVNPAGTKSEREAARRSNANAERLKHVPLPVVSNEVCHRALRDEQIAPVMPLPFGVLDNTQLCAGGIGDQDACYGDGGSPLACFDRDSFYVAGVVSYGRGCAEKMLPGVYASVPAQLEWITGVIEETHRRRG